MEAVLGSPLGPPPYLRCGQTVSLRGYKTHRSAGRGRGIDHRASLRGASREGFEPVIAGTAAEALELASSRSPDIVLLDLGLPDGSGLDVCRELRSRSTVPIIMVTARGRGDRPDRRARGRRGRLRGQALQRARGRRPDPGRAAPHRCSAADAARRRGGARRRARRSCPPNRDARRSAAELSRKEFDLLQLLVDNAGTVVKRER